MGAISCKVSRNNQKAPGLKKMAGVTAIEVLGVPNALQNHREKKLSIDVMNLKFKNVFHDDLNKLFKTTKSHPGSIHLLNLISRSVDLYFLRVGSNAVQSVVPVMAVHSVQFQ
ncbi:unnamed protein product [Thelazia callipaeda]|uniref:DUF667 domain-containing protein n=1 Tax=Thelazia callipaeda TaxID=103827 RepID=A0A0N5D423_THECL|nr:unnamed protein product [Thelazia callipaeda]